MHWKGCTTWTGEVAIFSHELEEEEEKAIPEERQESTCLQRSSNKRLHKQGQKKLGW